MRFKTIDEVKNLLISKIFTVGNRGVYLFDEDEYAALPGNYCLFMKRSDAPWNMIKRKYRYSIFQYERNFIFRTYKCELNTGCNEFLIRVKQSRNKINTITFISLTDKREQITLYSDQ